MRILGKNFVELQGEVTPKKVIGMLGLIFGLVFGFIPGLVTFLVWHLDWFALRMICLAFGGLTVAYFCWPTQEEIDAEENTYD